MHCTSVSLSVCLCVTLMHVMCWVSLKVITQIISLPSSLLEVPTSATPGPRGAPQNLSGIGVRCCFCDDNDDDACCCCCCCCWRKWGCDVCVEHGAAVSDDVSKSLGRESSLSELPPRLQWTLSQVVGVDQVTRSQSNTTPTHQEAVTLTLTVTLTVTVIWTLTLTVTLTLTGTWQWHWCWCWHWQGPLDL